MSAIAILVVVTLGLVVINGLYVAAEFAIIGARPSRLQGLAEAGHPLAARVLETVRSPRRLDAYISTAQVGITVASLGLAMYAEEALAGLLEPYLHRFGGEAAAHIAATGIALSILTYLHIVIGEMIPKAMALRDAETTAFRVLVPMYLSRIVFLPLVAPLTAIGSGVLRLLKVPNPTHSQRLLTPEELGMVIAQSTAGGLLDEREGRMLLSIFHFSEREVHHVMTPRTRVEAIPADIAHDELQGRLAAAKHLRFPVYEHDLDHIAGILHLKDYIRWRLDGDAPFDLAALLTEPLIVPEHMSVERLLGVLKREHAHMAVVIDEFGGTAGIVTVEDIAEEVVGDVRDEFDEMADVRVVRSGVLVVDGEARLDEVAEHVPLPTELPDVETVGGLVVTLLERPAQVGDEVVIGVVSIRVEEVDGLAVRRARITVAESD